MLNLSSLDEKIYLQKCPVHMLKLLAGVLKLANDERPTSQGESIYTFSVQKIVYNYIA